MSDLPLDAETKALESPSEHHPEVRLWLRLLTCANLIESQIRTRLRTEFNVTLPRFDLMAQLDRTPQGMTLSEVSRRMMVSNGNVTHVVEKLVASGDIERRSSQNDRRVQMIRLTPKGRAEFRVMAARHETWLMELFDGLSQRDAADLMRLLGRTKQSVRSSIESQGASDAASQETGT